MPDLSFQLADPDYYIPASEAEEEADRWRPAVDLDGWRNTWGDAWSTWAPASAASSATEQVGWKVHVSSTLANAQRTLDQVGATCLHHGVSFKHLAGELHFLLLHHKHGPRIQSGKFCAIYPDSVDQARSIMDELAERLAGLEGPYVLTDRRYGSSLVVSYRYGARSGLLRGELDGTRTPMMIGTGGELVPDVRAPEFVLPEGVVDPFWTGSEEEEESDDDDLLNGRYRVTALLQHSNAGGAYRAEDTRTGRTVLIKEARGHHGLTPDGTDAQQRLAHEWSMMRQIHAADPGLCPEPIELFSLWENDFLVMELVPGVALVSWFSHSGVLHRLDATSAEVTSYQRGVTTILAGLRDALDRLHRLGLGFGDVSHGNVMIDPASLAVRLIDFESSGDLGEGAERPGTQWYRAEGDVANTLQNHDENGFAMCAQLLLFPLPSPLGRAIPGRLELLRRDLETGGPLPERLWACATEPYRRSTHPGQAHDAELPRIEDLDERPVATLSALTERVRTGLLAMGRLDRDDWMFPVHPDAYATNTLSRAHGAAGVLDALRQVGTPAEPLEPYWDRLVTDTEAAGDDLAPGLRTGLAGISWALADAGRTDTALALIGRVHTHPTTLELMKIATDRDRTVPARLAGWAGLGHGLAGIGMVQLGLHRADPRVDLAPAIAIADLLVDQVRRIDAPDRVPGLDGGLSGIAMFLLAAADAVGLEAYRSAAVDYCRVELAHGRDDGEILRFTDHGGARTITYLALGSAGVACALTRAVAATGDPGLARALPRVLDGMRLHSSVQPGLDAGVSSWVWTFAEHARHAGGGADERTAVRIATSLAKYLVPVNDGLAPIDVLETRLHTGLSAGSAGVLLALAKVTGRPEVRAWTVA